MLLKYYYINLNHRTDRNNNLLKQFQLYKIDNYERIEANDGNGRPVLGCAKSHILALNKFIDSKEDQAIILEDDFQFKISRDKYEEQLNSLFSSNIDFNIVLLAGNVIKSKPFNSFLHSCINVQTTSGYIISKKFAPVLLTNFIQASLKVKPIDRHWKSLQKPKNNFFIFSPKCGKQSPGYSDIMKKKVNYRC